MSKKNTSKTLASSLATILVCSAICVIVTIVAAAITGELLYLVATVLFAVSGGAGVWVVRSFSERLGNDASRVPR